MLSNLSLCVIASLAVFSEAISYDRVKMLCDVNRIRVSYGLRPLGQNSALDNSAQQHCNYQSSSRRMSHTGRGGSDPGKRMKQAGYNWKAVAENIAYGYDDQGACLDQWMRSPGHRKNILGSKFTHLGSAVSNRGGTPYYTQDFAGDGKRHNFPVCPKGNNSYGDDYVGMASEDTYGDNDHSTGYDDYSDDYSGHDNNYFDNGDYDDYSNDYSDDYDSYSPSYDNDHDNYSSGPSYGYNPNYGHNNDNDDYNDYSPSYGHDNDNDDYNDYSPSYGHDNNNDHRSRPAYGYNPGYGHDNDNDDYNDYSPSYGHDNDNDHHSRSAYGYNPGYGHDNDNDHHSRPAYGYNPGYGHDNNNDHRPSHQGSHRPCPKKHRRLYKRSLQKFWSL